MGGGRLRNCLTSFVESGGVSLLGQPRIRVAAIIEQHPTKAKAQAGLARLLANRADHIWSDESVEIADQVSQSNAPSLGHSRQGLAGKNHQKGPKKLSMTMAIRVSKAMVMIGDDVCPTKSSAISPAPPGWRRGSAELVWDRPAG